MAKRTAHPSYKTMSRFKPKNQGAWRPGKTVGHTFSKRGKRMKTRDWKPR